MLVRTIKVHKSCHGIHDVGDEYDETKTYADQKIQKGIVIEVKSFSVAPENKSNGKRKKK